MGSVSSERFLVLHALRIKGLASAEAIADVTGLPQETITAAVENAAAEGLVKVRSGRVTGAMLTREGRPVHTELLSKDIAGTDGQAGLTATYEAFLPVNARFKDLCTRWQLRPVGTGTETNDHTDTEYDAAVIAELGELHEDVLPALLLAEAELERFGRYGIRLTEALGRVRAGDVAAFARPLAASYHDVWMELHEDLLVSLGRERDASDGH